MTEQPTTIGASTGAAAHWRQTLWAMVGIQFVMTSAFSMLSPIMPLFLPVLGVESAAGIALWAGVLNGVTSFVAAFASPLWGQVADRHGRKLMLLRSGLAIGFFTVLMGASANVWQFFACRALMGVFAGFSSAAIALVAIQVPEDRLGYSLGWLSTGQLVGSLVGPIVGGILADMTGSYRVPFYCTAATIFVAMGLVWFAVQEEFSRPAHGSGGRRGTLASLYALVTTPALLALFFVLLMAQFGVRTVQPIVTLYVQEMVGNLPNVATLAGIAFSITGLANVISAPFLGNRSDRIGYRRVLLICLAGGTITTLPQAFIDNYWLFTAARFALGLFIGGLLPAANAMVGRLVSRAERGAVYGMTSSAMFLGNSLGPLLGGAIAASFGLHWVFLMTAIVMAANLLWVYHRVPEYRSPTP
ncbi:MAG: MFS transporter [Alphaproteobacteria bacterium]|nr:MFS transporter [Alphaproteobacteria bacterium]MBV9587905.1 MFS transporter [Alphaproteobacteria bacterium]MBV9966519.1 MFS transporter [Alphaproteobacteria bacterium]